MKAPRALIHALLFIFLLVASMNSAKASRFQEQPAAIAAIQLQPVLTGLSSSVFVTNAGDGTNRLFVVEQGGVIRVVQPGASTSTVFLNITTSVLSGGEQGLLGLAFHPFYRNNGRFFVYYTRLGDGAIVIAEYHVSTSNPNVADTAGTPILVVPHPTNTNHNGGTIRFGPDGYLYAAPGDGGGGNDVPNNAQNIDQLLGKVLRIDIDHPNGAIPYSSPSTNPFVGIAGRDEIFAVGMRNPFRFSFDRAGTHQLYLGDVGQNAWEEIDIITLGGNYGWRVFEGMHCIGNDPLLCNSMSACTVNGYTCPIAEYSSLNPDPRCSITGGYVYRGPILTLPTVYLYSDFCTGEIFTLNPPTAGGAQTLLIDTALGVASFGEDETGEVYVADLNGTVQRITNTTAACSSVVSPSSQTFPASGGSGTAAVTTPLNCTWMATTTDDNSIHIASGFAGTGAGAVSYTVDANTSPGARTFTLTIAGQTTTVLQGAAFLDVAPSNPFYKEIGKLSARGVTLGCGGGKYCPDDIATREQMAAFILRALGEFSPPTPATQRFADVPPSNPFYNFIDRLAALRITLGCGGGNFCPSAPVTREQMAAFVLRALGETSPPATTFQRYVDVPPSNPFFRFIDRMAIRGITKGCNAANFCPSEIATRGQVAAFLARAFDL